MTTNLNGISVNVPESLYEKDFYLWIQATAQLLRSRQLDQLDFDNLIEEIESMGSSQLRELKSRLRVLLMHLLKYLYQSDKRSPSWLNTIVLQRSEIELLLEDSPSLQPMCAEVFGECYFKARRDAAKETGLSVDTFPVSSPFSIEDTLNPDYLPESTALK